MSVETTDLCVWCRRPESEHHDMDAELCAKLGVSGGKLCPVPGVTSQVYTRFQAAKSSQPDYEALCRELLAVVRPCSLQDPPSRVWVSVSAMSVKLAEILRPYYTVIGELRRKLAYAGVEGSPPPGEVGTIPRLMEQVRELTAERESLKANLAANPAPVLKPLVWVEQGNGYLRADTCFGPLWVFACDGQPWWAFNDQSGTPCESLDHGKSLAFDYYRQRVAALFEGG